MAGEDQSYLDATLAWFLGSLSRDPNRIARHLATLPDPLWTRFAGCADGELHRALEVLRPDGPAFAVAADAPLPLAGPEAAERVGDIQMKMQLLRAEARLRPRGG